MLNIKPGVLISTLGLIGMVITFVENTYTLGSKIPLVVFFLFLVILGIIYETTPKSIFKEEFGEVDGGGFN